MTAKQLKNLLTLIEYRDIYEISIQFWPDQTAVYISKNGIELIDYGGTYDFAIGSALRYLRRITRNRIKESIDRIRDTEMQKPLGE